MELSPQGLPIIDLSPAITQNTSNPGFSSLASHIATACETAGCFYIKNHGIDYSLIDSYFNDLKIFFSQPIDYKLKYKLDYSLDRGYFPFETQNVNEFMGRKNFPNDPLEKLSFGPPEPNDPRVAENIYPDRPESLTEDAKKIYSSYKKLAETLMRIFAYAVGIDDKNYFFENCHKGPHNMKNNFYPAYSKKKPDQNDRCPAHIDVTPFTILTTDQCPKALQVKNARDEWIYADPVPGGLFVNLGGVMQRWTNDRWKATEHRVCWPIGEEIPDRISVVYFVGMNKDALIECVPSCIRDGEKAKYDPITFDQYIEEYMKRLSVGAY